MSISTLEAQKKLIESLEIPSETLRVISDALFDDLRINNEEYRTRSLECPESLLSSAPARVAGKTCLAIDLGGTNLRVSAIAFPDPSTDKPAQFSDALLALCRSEIPGVPEHIQERAEATFQERSAVLNAKELQARFEVPESIKKSSTITDLFSLIAQCVAAFLNVAGQQSEVKAGVAKLPAASDKSVAYEPVPLGFTFSFAFRQEAPNSGTIMNLSKGYNIPDAAGTEVVAALQTQLDLLKINTKITALLNDTVATLFAKAQTEAETRMAIILGTGTNAAYLETKSPHNDSRVINTEWGAFDDARRLVPVNAIDRELDGESSNPDRHIFEKSVSARYLGEVLRRLTISLCVGDNPMFGGNIPPAFKNKNTLDTKFVNILESETCPNMSEFCGRFEEIFGQAISLDDAKRMRTIAEAICKRAAKLVASVFVAILRRLDTEKVTVAMDGTLWVRYDAFRSRLLQEVANLCVEYDINTPKVETVIDGSAYGAAVASIIYN